MNLYENFKNPRWRLNNLYTIVNKSSKRIKFQENPVQKILNDSPAKRKIILKARQHGVTTGEVLRQLDKVMFTKNFTACILAHEDDGIAKIFNTPRNAYKLLPNNLKPELDRGGGSKYEMFFPEINSRIYCDLESRGDTIQWLHVSEAAFMDQKRLNATLQAVPIDGIVTIETTPNGLENFFYEMWADNESNYEKFFFPWFFNPEYQIAMDSKFKPTNAEKLFIENTKSVFQISISPSQINYRRFKQEELKKEYIQEYPEDDITCFIHSGRTVVDQALFTMLIEKTKPVIEVIEEIQIFHKRDPKKSYVLGADVSQGIGADFSVCSVLCVEDLEEVGFYRGQLSPFLFAKRLKLMCDIFTSGNRVPLLAVEMNNHGHAVLLELRENIKYSNLYYREDKYDEPGWLTNSITRPIMIDQFIEAVGSETVIFNSKEVLKEARMLIEDKGKIQAPKGKFDDSVVAASIAVQMLLSRMSKVKLYENVSNSIKV